MRIQLLVVVTTLAACTGKRDVAGDGFTLAEATQRHCEMFKTELARAADEYRATRPNQFRAYGDSSRERGVAGLQLVRQLEHCVFVRNIERSQLDAISRRVAVAEQGFREANEPAAVAGELDKLAAIAREIDALPLRD